MVTRRDMMPDALGYDVRVKVKANGNKTFDASGTCVGENHTGYLLEDDLYGIVRVKYHIPYRYVKYIMEV